MWARGVVDAAHATACVGVAGARRGAGVCVPTAVARQADAVSIVEAITTLLAVGALVLRLALVTHSRATLIEVTAAGGGDAGAGARSADVCERGARRPVEIILAFLTGGAFSVTPAVDADA